MSAVDTRNVGRDSLFLFAELALEGRPEPVRVKVRNLSAGGMMAEGNCAIESGARLTIHLRNIGEVKGHVAWVQGNRFGIAFVQEINPVLARAPVEMRESNTPVYAQPAVEFRHYAPDPRRLRGV